ncbi:MAG: segregation/condensation protein A [Clostridiales bacterium]|jgi:segregation and condensation protein A|nr:segregation/condensation protein A [Clostridiales bacterium]
MEKNLLPLDVHIKLEAFEGPFDLLFHLIDKNQINLYDIPIAELTDQYVAVLKEYPGDMELISGFILMAATLLEIKSRMLLPKPQKETPEEDPRELLVERLLEYKLYKQAAEILKSYEAEGMKRLFREPEAGVFQRLKDSHSASAADALSGVSLKQFYEIYRETLIRRELRTDKVRAGFNAIPKDVHTIEEKIDYLRAILDSTPQLGFFGLLRVCRSKSEKVTTFLAMLELIKSKSVRFIQENNFEDILLERVEAG